MAAVRGPTRRAPRADEARPTPSSRLALVGHLILRACPAGRARDPAQPAVRLARRQGFLFRFPGPRV